MIEKHNNVTRKRLLPFPVIEEAVKGNVEAIDIVLRHYDGYIAKLSTRPMIDGSGLIHMGVDNDMKSRLQTALINKLFDFNIA